MPRFAIATTDSFDNNLQISFAEGPDAVTVARTFLKDLNTEWEGSLNSVASLEEIKALMFDADAQIDVKEIPLA